MVHSLNMHYAAIFLPDLAALLIFILKNFFIFMNPSLFNIQINR
jgi:hypothetical protein